MWNWLDLLLIRIDRSPLMARYADLCVTNRYQGQGQIITFHICCGMYVLAPALNTCFWLTSPQKKMARQDCILRAYAITAIYTGMAVVQTNWHKNWWMNHLASRANVMTCKCFPHYCTLLVESTGQRWIPLKRLAMRSFGCLFVVGLNKHLIKSWTVGDLWQHGPWWCHQMVMFSALLALGWGECTGHQWPPLTKASEAEL